MKPATAYLEAHGRAKRRQQKHFGDPFRIVTDQGHAISLVKNSPAMVEKLATEGLKRSMEKYVGKQFAKKHHSFACEHACMDLTAAAIKKGRKIGMTKKEVGAFRSAAVGGVLTQAEAKQRGYNAEDRCPLCDEEGDTLFHRTYGCRETRAAVKDSVPKCFWDEAMRADVTDPFWVTAACPHPSASGPFL